MKIIQAALLGETPDGVRVHVEEICAMLAATSGVTPVLAADREAIRVALNEEPRPSLIHCHLTSHGESLRVARDIAAMTPAGASPPICATFHGCSLIRTLRSGPDPDRFPELQAAFAPVAHLICVNPYHEACFADAGLIPRDRITAIPPFLGVAMQLDALPSAIRDFTGCRRPLLMANAHLNHFYGADTLLNAMVAVVDRYPESGLVVVGRGTEAASRVCEEGIAAWRLRENVLLVDSLPHPQMLSLFATSDLFVRPTRDDSFALSAVEAAAFGNQIIVSDIPGREVLEAIFPITRFAPENAVDLAEKILARLESPIDMRNGAAAVLRHGGANRRRLMELYRLLVTE